MTHAFRLLVGLVVFAAPVCRADLPPRPPEPAPAAPESATAPESAPSPDGTSFRAADPSKHKENLSGIPFLVGAYAAIWFTLFVFVVMTYRRALRLEGAVHRLRHEIARATKTEVGP